MNSTTNQCDNEYILLKSNNDSLLTTSLNFMVDNYQIWSRENKELRLKVSRQIINMRIRGRLLEEKYDLLVDVFDLKSFILSISNKVEKLHGKPRHMKVKILTGIYDSLVKEHRNWFEICDKRFRNMMSSKLVELRMKHDGVLESCKYDILLTEEDKILMYEFHIGKKLNPNLISLVDNDELSKMSQDDRETFCRMANKLFKKN